eukprot:Blabericola_migrator_1__5531@NODE_281_length_10429_cov_52_996912_g231_i0_p11_GENE_NODE_281_length_10429_cov_52_996912_g231_i0NODE_281_length_10429_cov_52_996912_g231_i0_p11_ORF_typecomplete_len116_score18_86LCCL/PF03815_19/4e12Rxt3/PF08642_10/0_0097_NODE_281_length_10429_cov_52_996912_g231_i014271774
MCQEYPVPSSDAALRVTCDDTLVSIASDTAESEHTLLIRCPADCAVNGSLIGENILGYRDDSNLCLAAKHAGVIDGSVEGANQSRMSYAHTHATNIHPHAFRHVSNSSACQHYGV